MEGRLLGFIELDGEGAVERGTVKNRIGPTPIFYQRPVKFHVKILLSF